MSNSVSPRVGETAGKPANKIRVQHRSLSVIGVGAHVGFVSERSLPAPFEIPSSGVSLLSRPFSPTAPEFIPGAVYASRHASDTTVNPVNTTRPLQDDEQGGVSLVPRRILAVSSSESKIRGIPPTTEHGQGVLTDAQNRASKVFQRTGSVPYDLEALPQHLLAPKEISNRPYHYYQSSKLLDDSTGARLLAPPPPHMEAFGQITARQQYAHMGLHRLTSQNNSNTDHAGPFDERWVESPEKMWNTDTTRTSPLTISPGESGNDSEVGNVSSESSSGRSSIVDAVTYPSSTIAHAIPSGRLTSWLEAVRPNIEARTSLDLQHNPVHRFFEEQAKIGEKGSRARNEQHQAKQDSGNFAHEMSSGVLYPTNEYSEHGSEPTVHAKADLAGPYIEGKPGTALSTPQHAFDGAIAELTKESPGCSKRPARIAEPYCFRREGSPDLCTIYMDRIMKIAEAQAIDAAAALEALAQQHQQCDQVETRSGSRGDTTWIFKILEFAKRRRAMSTTLKAKEENGLNEKADGGLCASASSQDLPSVVVTPNMDSLLAHGELVLFEGTGATAQDTSVLETSDAGHTLEESRLACIANQSQHDLHPEVNKNIEHAGTFSSQLPTDMRQQHERIETLRILQTQLSMDITLQDTYGQQQRSQRLRPDARQQLYYEMKDLDGKPHLLSWPPEEGSAAYIARYKPDQLLHLEVHPKGFFISHPIEGSREIVDAHYTWISTGLSNIKSHANPHQVQSQLGKTQPSNQPRSPAQHDVNQRFVSAQHGMQQLDFMQDEIQHFGSGQSTEKSPGNTQNKQQGVGPFQTNEPGDDYLEALDAMSYRRQPVRSFVPTNTGPLVIVEDGVPTTESSVLDPMTSACASQSTRYSSVCAPALAGPSALAALNNNRPDYSDSTPGSYRSSHRPAMLPYRPGVDTMFPVPMAGPSLRYQRLTRSGQPNYEVATKDEFQPFFEAARLRKPAFWGVMKFTGIPYAVSKQDILAFLGRNAKILTPNYGEPIHIIMERATGKTMDAYVEFFSHADAQAAVSKFMRGRMEQDRSFRMMDRHVKVELSSQEALMRDLFPKAKNVRWNGQIPIIVPSDDPFNSGFKSFLSGEELHTLTKLVDSSNGPMFCRQCPSRPYENMISTLHKFPWFAVQLYTLFQRDQLFNATLKMLRALMATVSPTSSFGLTSELLMDLLYAGLNAPGFSEKQKWELCQVADWAAKAVAISPLTRGWPWLVLARKPDWDDDVIMYYAQILNAYSQKRIGRITANDSFFSDMLTSQLRISVNASLEAAAQTEWQHFKDLVKLVLDNQIEKHSGMRRKRPVTNNPSTTNNHVKMRTRSITTNGPTMNNASVMNNSSDASYYTGQGNFVATNSNNISRDSFAKASYLPGMTNLQALSSSALASNLPVTSNISTTTSVLATSSYATTSNFSGTNISPATGNIPRASRSTATDTPPAIKKYPTTGSSASTSHRPTASYPIGTSSSPAINDFSYASGPTIISTLPAIKDIPTTGSSASTSHRPTTSYPIGTSSSSATSHFPVTNNFPGLSSSSTPSYLPGTSNHRSRGSFFMPSKSPTTSNFSGKSNFMGTGVFAMTSKHPGAHNRLSSMSPTDMGNFPAIGTAAPPRSKSDVASSVTPKYRWQ
ncbi:hypothetical protein MMC18_003174 [Xylographa bjoerkii]|nr:hypothetical protein [Xylographa bjoerkii]